MDSRSFSCLTYVFAALILLATLAPQGMAQADVTGQWSTLPYTMPINPIHIALLNNGKILVVAGSGNCPPSQQGCPSGPPYGPGNNSGALLWDPVAEKFTQFSVSWDMFCNAMIVLQDGTALIDGGTINTILFTDSRWLTSSTLPQTLSLVLRAWRMGAGTPRRRP